MEMTISDKLDLQNRQYMETCEVYHLYARRQGMSDTVLWVFYFLDGRSEPFPLKELCSRLGYPVQTVNSAIKAMERQGLVRLEYAPGSKKSKAAILTLAGRAEARRVILPLVEAEYDAISSLTDEEWEELSSLSQKHLEILKRQVEKLP